jgi:hypothetical protein
VDSLPRTEAPPPAAEPDGGEPVPDTSAGAPHLADPRALQILSTEHWSLLTARSLVYNEMFSRGGMFLTLTSASLVALGFVYQGSGGGGPNFPLIVVAVLGLDLFVGVATLGRLVGASAEELKSIQAMNRIRHAYLEMVPSLEAYFSTSPYDDIGSTLSIYGAVPERPFALLTFVHGLTTMPGMLSVLNSTLVGALVGALTIAVGGEQRLAFALGVVAGLVAMVGMTGVMIRTFGDEARLFEARFPAPGAGPVQPPGRRNT